MARRDLTDAERIALRELCGSFTANLPQGASSGLYEVQPGDRFEGVKVTAPDGLYRVHGSDWLMTIRKGLLASAARATPPKFGGPNVVQVLDTPTEQLAAAAADAEEAAKPADGSWDADTVTDVKRKIDDLVHEEPLVEGGFTLSPKYRARLIVLAAAAGINVPVEIVDQAEKLLAADAAKPKA